MWNSGKNFALCATKKINFLTLVLSEKKILNETKNHNPPPPLQVKWSVPYMKVNKIHYVWKVTVTHELPIYLP